MALYICEIVHENILNSFQLTKRTWVHGGNDNVQRAITPKVGKPDLEFMCSARRLIVLCICVKFCENNTSGIRVMEQTRVHGRNGCVQWSKHNNSVSRQTRVTVHTFCTSSHGALHWCKVSWKYLKQFQSYGGDMKLWHADGWMDTQNFRRYNIIPRRGA